MSFDYKTYFLSDLSKHFETCPACEYNQASVANGFLFPFSKITCTITVKFYFIIFGNGIICIHCTRVHVLYFIFGSVYYFYYLVIFILNFCILGLPGKTIVAYTFQFITVLCSFITMWVSSSPSVSFFRYFGFPCVYLFFAVVGLCRRNRFQFKVIMTPEQLSMNCNCHLATYRCFVCCSFIFYCCVVIFIQWYYSNENLFLLLHHGY